MNTARKVRLMAEEGEEASAQRDRVLFEMLEHKRLLYHLVRGDTYHTAARDTIGDVVALKRIPKKIAQALISDGAVKLIEEGTRKGKHPYKLYEKAFIEIPDTRQGIPEHDGFTYFTLPSGASLGYCETCGAWHLPGDYVAVLTLQELLEYFYQSWTREKGSPLAYLMRKPGKPPSHIG